MNKNIDSTYLGLIQEILHKGYKYDDPYRKGVQRIEISQFTLTHDLTESFPAIQAKKLFFGSVQNELLCFLSGSTNLKSYWDRGVDIWDDDGYKYYVRRCKEAKISYVLQEEWKTYIQNGQKPIHFLDGELGKIYPYQWRSWDNFQFNKALYTNTNEYPIDQIARTIENMRNKPLSTDIIVNAWNPANMPDMSLPPCHYGFQILGKPLPIYRRRKLYNKASSLSTKAKMDFMIRPMEEQEETWDKMGIPKYGFILEWQQRSVDTFLGLPFNIASYALLAHILGAMTNMVPLGIIGNLKKVHLYDNSIKEAKALLEYSDKENNTQLVIPEGLTLDSKIDNFLVSVAAKKFELNNYKPEKAVKVKMLSRD